MSTPFEQWLPGMDVTARRLEAMAQRSWLMVTNLGADSSGATNAAPGIQATLNYARDLGGAWVLVPPGVYLIGQTLRIYSNTRLTLMAGAEFRRAHAGTMIVNGDFGQAFPGYTGHSRITIEGGLWNMRGTFPGLTGSAMCISIGHATDITIQDLEVRDTPGYHAIELNSTSHGVIRNCKFRGYSDPGGRDFSEAIQMDLAKSSGAFGAFGPYDHTPCEDVLITGCHVGASGTPGTTAWPRGVGSHSATITKYHRRVRISDCSFENLLQYAVSAYNWEDTTITGNTFLSCGSGVRLRTVIVSDTEDTKLPDGTQTSASQVMRNLSITGNTFRAGGGYDEPIVALGETSGQILNLTVAGNSIDGSSGGQNGIRLQQVSRAAISGNVIANIDGTGISTEDSGNLVITGNEVWLVGSNGITFTGCDHSSAVANQVREPGASGILVTANSNNIHLRDNYIKSPSRAKNGDAWGIRLQGGSSSISLSGNKVRPHGSGNEASHAFSAEGGTNPVTLIQRYGNDWRGSWTVAPVAEGSGVTSNTSAADVTT
ncbi:right-handed parallel beta-helix repeat-containing protein [Streptomyces sp. CC224B]|uniref:right-handed parallel beta-helix repeat-containing protein n=1 Tax=Streptomyces sp. CC224B TaxID=3044571 RepID=UPI0024A87557|nr:right-handed parallel beta-helix repeat-containing protein [Streptomyces sp. CC224B]